jgi:uracil-DNA glycosylase
MIASVLPDDWKVVLADALAAPSWSTLQQFVADERASGTIYPPANEVFTAFHLTPFANVRVLLLGQDPYPNEGEGHGLCFSVKPGVKLPASLRNIYKELQSDFGIEPSKSGFLESWAKQGILMLNAVMTVRHKEINSHAKRGWEQFTDAAIAAVNAKESPVVFVLWGAHARKKIPLIDATRHCIVESAHPSPLSANTGFFGSKPFSKINASIDGAPIDWRIEP